LYYVLPEWRNKQLLTWIDGLFLWQPLAGFVYIQNMQNNTQVKQVQAHNFNKIINNGLDITV